MTTGDIADRLGVTASTVRRWTDAFGDFLSESANPPRGEVRRFTEEDAGLLAAVAHYSKELRLTYDDIRGKLEAGEHLSETIPTPAEGRSDEEADGPPERAATARAATAPAAPLVPTQRLDTLIEEIRILAEAHRSSQTAVSDQLESLERRLGELETRLGTVVQVEDLQRELEGLRQALPAPGIPPETMEQHVSQLREELASRKQADELLAVVSELRDVTRQHAEEETAQAHRLAHLEEQVARLEVMLEEGQSRRGVRRLYNTFSRGRGKVTAQAVSWTFFVIAALGMLYYLALVMSSIA